MRMPPRGLGGEQRIGQVHAAEKSLAGKDHYDGGTLSMTRGLRIGYHTQLDDLTSPLTKSGRRWRPALRTPSAWRKSCGR